MPGYSREASLPSTSRRVTIVSVDMKKKIATGRDQQSGALVIDLSLGLGPVFVYPSQGEEWYVTKVRGNWVLDRRTSFQNPASTVPAVQGDWVIHNPHGKIKLSDVEGPVGSAGTIKFGNVVDRRVVVGSTAYVVEVLDSQTGAVLGYIPVLS